MTDLQIQPGSPQHLGRLKAWPLKIKIIAGVVTALIGVGSTATIAVLKIDHERRSTPETAPPVVVGDTFDTGSQPPSVAIETATGPTLAETVDAECRSLQIAFRQATQIADPLAAFDQTAKVSAQLADNLAAVTDAPAVVGAVSSLRDASDGYAYAAQLTAVGETAMAQQASDDAWTALVGSLQTLAELGAPSCAP